MMSHQCQIIDEPLWKSRWKYHGLDYGYCFYISSTNNLISSTSLALSDTKIYRNILYMFCQYREFINFSYIPIDPSGKIHFDLVIEKRQGFYEDIYGQNKINCSQICYLHNSIKELMNNFTEQFVNDLISVSQHNGYYLLTKMYPPVRVREYYNTLKISQIIFNLYKNWERDNLCNLTTHVDQFIWKIQESLPREILEEIISVLERDLENNPLPEYQDQFIEQLSTKLSKDRQDLINEILYLFGSRTSSGPYNSYTPCPNMNIGTQISNFISINPSYSYGSSEKILPYLYILQDWKDMKIDSYIEYNEDLIAFAPAKVYNLECTRNHSSDSNLALECFESLKDESQLVDLLKSIRQSSSEDIYLYNYPNSNEKILHNIALNVHDNQVSPTENEANATFQDHLEGHDERYTEDNEVFTDTECGMSSFSQDQKPNVNDLDPECIVLESRLELADNIRQSFLFKLISPEILKYMKGTFYQQRLLKHVNPYVLKKKERECLLHFLSGTGQLCELHVDTLWKILSYHNFLGRSRTECYRNFIKDLRSRLADEIDDISRLSKLPFSFYESVYETLKNSLFR